MISPHKLEEDIRNLDYATVEKILDKATNQADINFWLTIRDRALQLAQKEVINRKDFIR